MLVRGKRTAARLCAALATAGLATLAALTVPLGPPAGAETNRAKPLKPKSGSKYFERNPTVVEFRWFIPKGESAGHIEFSKLPGTDRNGSFRHVVRREKLNRNQTKERVGLRHANRYYWHVSSISRDGAEVYGRSSTIVILNTLSNRKAIAYSRDAIKYRIPRKFNLKRLRCRRESKLAVRCKWRAVAGDATLSGKGKTFLSSTIPDNLRYYHYDYDVQIVSEACVKDDDHTREECTEHVRWAA